MQHKHAIIIGSGVAGLAAATRLSIKGYRVSVYEKNSYPGGKLSVFEKDGYRFDAGPSLFTQPQLIEELFKDAGEPIDNHFRYQQVDIACRYFYENGKLINAYADKEAFASELQKVAGENPANLIRYLDHSKALYNDVGEIFVNHSLHKRNTWLNRRVIKALRTVKFQHLFSTLNSFNTKNFNTPETQQLFNRYATYNGSNPYKAPGMLSLIPHLEQNLGTFYPEGGMISITNALYELAVKKGVTFHFNKPVERIIHHEGQVRGVVAGGQNIHSDIVLSNGDIYFTYNNLLSQPHRAKKILKHERSSSALIFYWGIGKEYTQLHLHNILFSKNYKEEFDHIFNKKIAYNDPTVYINITSKMEQGHAPAGKENWFVMVNTPANYGQDWPSLLTQVRRQAIEKINRVLGTDIESFIETEEILDPVSIETKTGSYMGSLYGTSSNDRMAAFNRHPNFTTYIKGLYFCGGSVHPGGGIPLCMKSAEIVSNLVASDHRKAKH